MQKAADVHQKLLLRVGSEIKRRRLISELTQIQLAADAGVHPNVIGRLERGAYNPTLLIMAGIAAALGTTLPELTSVTRVNQKSRPKLRAV